ncbi:MAG TPA: ferredoxin reductase [Conexibacter sp.]|nr:ferredoxin reductase [Conexibacter sp.]
MAERGARPAVPEWRLRGLRALRSLFTPLLPDDYLELINPLWSTQELRGRIERIEPEAGNAVTVTIKPGWEWPGHRPGQYLRVGMPVAGIHHWRAYSITSDPDRDDGCISITPKLVEAGKVSPYLNRAARPGAIVRLGGVEGAFTLPDPLPAKLLFVSAGSGITPIMSMLRSLDHERRLADVVHLHSARTPGDVIFGEELRAIDRRNGGFRLHEQHTAAHGRITPTDLDRLCPDWRERETFLSGPAEMLSAFTAHWKQELGNCDQLHVEHFQPYLGGEEGEQGDGGTIHFRTSGVTATSDGSQPILVAGEDAGATLPYGCRMGICHTCVGRLCHGRVRDLRTGEVHGQSGEMVRTCINAPEGAVDILL